MSFVGRDDVMRMMERLIQRIFAVGGIAVNLPIRRISYKEAIERYGSDKPDLRFGLELVDVTDIVRGSGFKVFADAAKDGLVKAINAKGAARWSRREIDQLTEQAIEWGAKGLAWIAVGEGGSLRSAITKFMAEEEIAAVLERLAAEPDELL